MEDLDPAAVDEFRRLLWVPAHAGELDRAGDVLFNAGAALYGILEATSPEVSGFLNRHAPLAYTFEVSPTVSRGSRPTPQKLQRLYAQGYRATVNLCREMTDGDELLVQQAGLHGELNTFHVAIVDDTAPSDSQTLQFLDLLPENGPRTYVHCEAGVGRTGVTIAQYRIAVCGWSVNDAAAEAQNFGLRVPDQLAAIERFGARLMREPMPSHSHADRTYPVRAIGSVPGALGANRTTCEDEPDRP